MGTQERALRAPNVNSARVPTRCNGAAADQKTASTLIRLGEPHRKCYISTIRTGSGMALVWLRCCHLLAGSTLVGERGARGDRGDPSGAYRWPVDEGFVLDRHVISSRPIGYLGEHMQFETTRSALGELIYQLKYRNGKPDDIVETPRCLRRRTVEGVIDCVVPPPPSLHRTKQPAVLIAEE